ncbi:MAG: GH1 family beta-glucosidase [Verrucomicrobiae bacterium]|nr:GH1 family beta-glucosidase [Verrucomicrobiae bacterium]
MSQSYQFPPGFHWGTATAAYQIEGAARLDGRGPSTWDRFSQQPGRVRTGETGEIACDHYHRFEDDVKMMAALGLKHYRMSLAWSRILPEGTGTVNQKGLDFYNRLVDCLLAHGITPHVTLFHWDSPWALEDRYGSWRSRQMARDFADYATVAVRALGDRVTHWMTMNEVLCFTYLGYGVGGLPPHAPGTVVGSKKEVWQTVHHAMLGHGLAVQAIRAATPRPCKVALVDNCVCAIPLTETPQDIAAAGLAFQDILCNGATVYPALTGRYSDLFIRRKTALGEMPDIQDGDMETIHQPLDAFGLNIYTGYYARHADNADGYEEMQIPEAYPKMNIFWLNFLPDAMYWLPRLIQTECGFKGDIYITENGCPCPDKLTPKNEIEDQDRIMFLRSYLRQLHRAIDEGYPIKGYFLWTLLDNFEWAWGTSQRFGIHYTRYETQERIPKASAKWYAEVIRQNRVV